MHHGRTSAALRHLPLQSLRETLRGLERAEGFRAKTGQAALPFGIEALDSLWPEGGLPRGALHEIAGAEPGLGSFAAVTGFAASLAGRSGSAVLWCARGRELYGPGLAAMGLGSQRLIVAEARGDKDLLSAMEEGLRSGVLGAVVGEVERMDLTASRRLQLAAEKTGCMALVLRRPEKRPGKYGRADAPITAASRWRVGPAPAIGPQDFYQIQPAHLWRLELARSRCGAHGSWIVEAPDAQGHLRLPALLADRSLGAPERAHAA